MKRFIITSLLAVIVLAGCKKDNFEKPKSVLKGSVVYNKRALGLRSNGVQLELWQRGYELFTKIPVYVNEDGTFSSLLFDGNYKLVLRQGNGPWKDNSDSLDVTVNGTTNVEVSVQPYFVIQNATFTKNGTTVTAVVTIETAANNLPLESVTLYAGTTGIVDQVNNSVSSTVVPDVSQPVTLSLTIPATGVFYARVGVKTSGIAEQVYSQTEKIQ